MRRNTGGRGAASQGPGLDPAAQIGDERGEGPVRGPRRGNQLQQPEGIAAVAFAERGEAVDQVALGRVGNPVDGWWAPRVIILEELEGGAVLQRDRIAPRSGVLEPGKQVGGNEKVAG